MMGILALYVSGMNVYGTLRGVCGDSGRSLADGFAAWMGCGAEGAAADGRAGADITVICVCRDVLVGNKEAEEPSADGVD